MNERLIELAARLQSRSVLITGATGGIGQRLLQALDAAEVGVRALSRSAQVRQGGAAVEWIQADLTRPESLQPACQGIDLILHLASYTPAPADPDPEGHVWHQAVTERGTANLLLAAQAAGVDQLVFASSTRVIDGSNSLYARCKRAAEQSILASPLDIRILRLAPVYGILGRGSMAAMLRQVEAGRFPPIPEFGERRSLVHVDDSVQALLLAALHAENSGAVFTVTDLQEYSLRQIYELMCRVCDRPVGRAWPKWVFQAGALVGEAIQRLLHRSMPLNWEKLEKMRRSAWFDGQPIVQAWGYAPQWDLHRALPSMLEE